ncbi:MAG: hypothetical protein AB7N65_20270 [Vicinamibacterales bacterium]
MPHEMPDRQRAARGRIKTREWFHSIRTEPGLVTSGRRTASEG